MRYGLETYNENGVLIFSEDSTVTRFFAEVNVPALDPGQTVLIPIPGLNSNRPNDYALIPISSSRFVGCVVAGGGVRFSNRSSNCANTSRGLSTTAEALWWILKKE